MSQENLYLFEVEIADCTISVQPEGQFSLFLRIGKTTSSFLKAKSYNGRIMVFDSVIRCNCDQSALDTKRVDNFLIKFSLTLNMKTSNKENKVLGIVMIPLQEHSHKEIQTFRIAQSSDPEAVVHLKYSVNLIGGNQDVNKKGSGLSSSLTHKKSDSHKKSSNELKIASSKTNQKKKQNSHLFDSIFTSPITPRLTTAQFIEDVKTLQKQQICSQNEEITRLKQVNSKLLQENEKLKREKSFLKELVKIETSKNNLLSKFLEKVYSVFVEQRISDVLSGKKIEKQPKEEFVNKEKTTDQQKNKLYNSVSSIGQNSTINPLPEICQKSRFQIGKNDNKKGSDSRISFSKLSSINEDLSSILKDSIIKEREESRNTISQLRKVLMDESDLKHERRLRSVKIKVEKSYLELFKDPQPYTKENIMKQKISVNKILDELLMCTVIP